MEAHTRARFSVPPSLVVGAALAGAVLAGTAMAYRVQLGLAVAVALCFVPLTLMNLPMAIVIWLPSVSLIAVTALNVGPNIAGIMILFAWLGALATRRSRVLALIAQHRQLLVAVAALVLWVLLSMAWAPQSSVGDEIFFGWLAAGAIVLVVSTTLTDRRYLRLAVAAFVAGIVVSVIVGLAGGDARAGLSAEDAQRLTGGSGDPNFLAAGIVPGIVLTAGLGAGSRRLVPRLTALAVVLFLAIALVATESRGGFVAAIVAAVAVVVLAKQHRAWAVGLLLCVVGAIVAWFTVDPAAWERVSDLSQSNGRTELWGVAWQMWQDHPFAGVGLQGFLDNAAQYARQLGPLQFAEFITEQPHVVHNIYLELLAETGVVGLALYVGVVVGSVRRAWRAATLYERSGDLAMVALTRSVIAAVLAMLASGAFVSGATDRRFWVLLALGPALLAGAALRARGDDSAAAPTPRPRPEAARRRIRPPVSIPSPPAGAVSGPRGRPATP